MDSGFIRDPLAAIGWLHVTSADRSPVDNLSSSRRFSGWAVVVL